MYENEIRPIYKAMVDCDMRYMLKFFSKVVHGTWNMGTESNCGH